MNIKEIVHSLPFHENQIYVKEWQPEPIHDANQACIILIHESLGSVALWKDFPKQLAEITQRRVFAYDRLGFGQSSALTDPLELNFVQLEAEQSFTQLIQYFKLEKFIVMGHSVGGGMASSCATIFPTQCKAVIVESAQSCVEEVTLAGIREAKINFKNEKLFQRLAKYHAEKTQWVLDAWTETWLSAEFKNWNLDQILPKVYCPMLILHGELDQYATLAQPQRFAELTRGEKQLVIIPDCGHFPHFEKTEIVLQSIQLFLNDTE